MTPNITAGMALRDALFAAGVGLFVGLFYALLAPLCRKGAARFALDTAVPAAAALWLRSAAASRMYGGFVRWYHVCACALAAAVCAAALRGPAQGLHAAVRAVLRALCAPLRRLGARGQSVRENWKRARGTGRRDGETGRRSGTGRRDGAAKRAARRQRGPSGDAKACEEAFVGRRVCMAAARAKAQGGREDFGSARAAALDARAAGWRPQLPS